jgi:6,7-dimethyl-8-ribityllumazine synthase
MAKIQTSQKNDLQNAKGLKIGVVTARWNPDVTDKLEEGALSALREMGCTESDIRAVSVPGCFEVPLAVKALLEVGCDGVIALGAVIRGETTHYDYVCSSVERGCTELQLRFGKPVGFGILTTENDEQAHDRAGGKHGNKGAECARVVVEMVRLLDSINSTGSIGIR